MSPASPMAPTQPDSVRARPSAENRQISQNQTSKSAIELDSNHTQSIYHSNVLFFTLTFFLRIFLFPRNIQ